MHRLQGRVQGHGQACKARFKISFFASGRSEWVIQEFAVTFIGTQVHFRGHRIVARNSVGVYFLDTFTGSFNKKRTRFTGSLRDAGNITGPVTLRRR